MRNRILSSVIAVAWGLMSSRAAIALPAQEPLFLVTQVSPMVMFATSVDHQLFIKAFADYSDLNGDGVIDSSYVDSFDYYGYFDSNRCYEYDTSAGYFRPRNAASGANNHHCNNSAGNGNWSGNFLNWASMTRIDVLRKALYGGKRAIDTATQTVLERELLSNDFHAFAKVFTPVTGDDMRNYTPYNVTTLTMCNSTPQPTTGSDETQSMSTVTNPPQLRIANGDWGRWDAGERNQCEWYETNTATNYNKNSGTVPRYSDNLFSSGTRAAPNVKVEVCVTGKREANCKSYNGTDAKPTGLLQDYGEDGALRFGLLSGSYQKRDHGGVLRKTISKFAGNTTASDDEVNLANGTFNSSVNGIIGTLDKVRLNTWDYGDTHYNDCDRFAVSINEYLTSTNANRRCSNWGNPLSEIYLEAVRYLAGEGSATSTFNVATDSLSLPTATWDDPMSATDYCTPMNVVVLASGDNSFDTDNLSNVPTALGNISTAVDAIGTAERTAGSIASEVFIGEVGASPLTNPDYNVCSAKTFTSLSQMRGLCPATPVKQGGYGIAGIAHKARTVDLRTTSGYDGDQTIKTFALAMAKSLPEFVFDVNGSKVTIVPVGYARFNSGDPWAASSLGQLSVLETVVDPNSGKVTYMRVFANWEDSQWGNDYDMDVGSWISICVGAECENHDDDGNGHNDTNPGNGNLRVTTRAPLAASGAAMLVGFIASGTTNDGVHATLEKVSGGFYTSLNATYNFGETRNPSEPNPAADANGDGRPDGIVVLTPGASTAKNMPTPLQLAAKYGSFNDSNNNDMPDLQSEWDEDGDGVADGFFFADDPSQIGPKLASFLSSIATTSSSASVVANSVSLQTQTRLFQARFDSEDWSGSVVSLPVSSTGALLSAEWDVADRVDLQNHDTGREWMTWDASLDGNGDVIGGIPFRWASLNAAQKTALNLNPGSGSSDSRGSERLDWLRGDKSNEIADTSGLRIFRDRNATVLGDVVNSTPTVVGAPNYNYLDSLETVPYSTFKAANDDVECRDSNGTLRSVNALDREPMLYFGGNDGALHGISACTGDERFAYVPQGVYSTLNQLTSPNYQHKYYVDGPVTVVDAFFGGAWHSVLVGTQGAGGSGIFALDVTDPGKFDETYASDVVLWDIQATPGVSGSPFEELGYAMGQVSIVKAKYHGWVAIFGNGYHGQSGKAILYIVRLSDGSLLQSIDLSATGPGSTLHGASNGLSAPAPVDTDGDGEVDLIYAGDLNGNLWRFKATSAGFTRAATTLLYRARSVGDETQKITARVAVGYHPTSATGRIVYFGTGKYYELIDQDPANAVAYNTMYGIWDRDDDLTVTSVTTRNSNVLQKQTITLQELTTFGTNTETIRIVSNTPVQWANPDSSVPTGACAANQSCGWYLDLTDTGEKAVSRPILRGGRLIFVTALPSPVACDEGGSGWLMEIDPNTGGRLDVPVLDLNGDGLFDNADTKASTVNGQTTYTPPSGTKSKIGLIQNPAIVSGFGDGSFQTKNFSGSKNAQIDVKKERPDVGGEGRKSWVRIK
ncbi:MAG: hypothetical protein KDI82_04710 [Gammaproteobacteria bacterium]|nr:hypothetical protein [Gammaproteobacteria bacterium]